MAKDNSKEAYYFCDESSFIDDEFMAVAGLAFPIGNTKAIMDAINKIRGDLPKTVEIKWGNTRERGVPIRQAYISKLIELVDAGLVHFHIRFSPMDEYDHDGPRKRFDTVSKSYYQLLLHRTARYYGDRYQIRVRPDDGECTSKLKSFAGIVGRDAAGRYDGVRADCIESIICLNSKAEPLLQFVDVPLGALCAHRNSRHLLANTSSAKRELAEFAFDQFRRIGLKDLGRNYDEGKRLSVWNVIPSRKRGPGS